MRLDVVVRIRGTSGARGVAHEVRQWGSGWGRGEIAKMLRRADLIRPPPPKQKVSSGPGPATQNGDTAPTLLPSDIPKTLSPFFRKFVQMLKRLNMNNSIYNTKYSGLTVRNGRLINEQIGNPMAGITRAAMERKAMKEQKKISRMEEAYVRAEQRNEAIEQLRDMLG